MQNKANAAGSPAASREEEFKERTWKDSNFYMVMARFAKNRLTLFGAVIILLLLLMAIFAPVISPYNYTKVNPIEANQAPSLAHILGTDILGRDMFSRICYGARYSLSLGICAELAGLLIGIILGNIAGYFGGILDNVILRLCDILQSIPSVLLTICIAQVLGSGYVPTVIALGITGTPQVIRLLRAQLLSVRNEEYVEAARTINCSSTRIMFKHLLPNSIAPLIINSSMGIGAKIMASAGLSYLGLGIQEPLAEWGAILSAGKDMFRYYPHLVLAPGAFIAITVLAFNLVGDGLRDALDSKLRQ